MVATRAAVQQAGRFEPLTSALVEEAGAAAGCDLSVVLDVGAGTGHHLASVLEVPSHTLGIALDASRDASRRAARAHPRIAAVRADVWDRIPLGDASIDLALSVFAPRNGAELARVMRPGGSLLVVTPRPEHLRELAALHTVRVDAYKLERVCRQRAPELRPSGVRQVTWTLSLTRHEAEAVLRMGPAGRHVRPDLEHRVAGLPEPVRVTSAIELRTFRRPGTGSAGYASERRDGTARVRRSGRLPRQRRVPQLARFTRLG